jgi:replicative DNA helicase
MSKPKSTDRLPPNSPEAEQGVLGSILLSPEPCMNELEEMGAQAEWFYDLRHQLLFNHFLDMHQHGRPIEMLALVERLTVANCLAETGGLEYVTTLQDKTPSASNCAYYADIVRKNWLSRRMIQICQQSGGAAFEGKEDADALVADFERKAAELSEACVLGKEQNAGDVLCTVIEDLDKYHRGHAQIHGLTLGLDYVDKMLCGIGGDENNMVVIAGRPGTGKTSFALDVALHAALDFPWFTPKSLPTTADEKVEWQEHRGVPVAIFSLEMTTKALVKRMLFQRARADMQRFRTGLAYTADFPKLAKATAEIKAASDAKRLWIDESGRQSIEQIKAKARRLKRQFGIRLFILDYIQLMWVSGKRYKNDRVQELSEISGELQKLAKELQTPFLILAQMNRAIETAETKRSPQLSDLRDSGAIEQDADIVGFLYSTRKMEEDEKFQQVVDAVYPEVDGKRDWSAVPNRVNLLIAKSRNGPTGDCKLLFFKSCTHFEDYVEWLKRGGQKELSTSERPAQFGDQQNDLEPNER